jgi:hypothetical protein
MVFRIGKSMIEDAEAKGLIVPGKVDVISIFHAKGHDSCNKIKLYSLNCMIF